MVDAIRIVSRQIKPVCAFFSEHERKEKRIQFNTIRQLVRSLHSDRHAVLGYPSNKPIEMPQVLSEIGVGASVMGDTRNMPFGLAKAEAEAKEGSALGDVLSDSDSGEGCIYNAQGDVTCGLPVRKMMVNINRAPQSHHRDEVLRNIGGLATDAIHMREPEYTFTYNPDICCRKTCGRVAPCESARRHLEHPWSLCSACQKGLCDRRC